MKSLIFTDSRGQHKESFLSKPIFTEKLHKEFNSELLLCPYKWTTTMHFIELIENGRINIDLYDKIILYTGVVEFSPRPISNFKNATKDNEDFLRDFLGSYFDEATTYGIDYMGEDTKSIISLNAYEEAVIPYLKTIGDKLILINTNKIVKNWEGDYLKVNSNGRPKNIDVVEQYSEKTIGNFKNLVSILEWGEEEVKKYTVDNMHLTYAGSEYVYNKTKEYLK
jgi:hypothetical protein